MALDGEVYFLTPDPYADEVSLGCFAAQTDSLIYDGTEEVSVLGTILPFMNSVRCGFSLSEGSPISGANFRKLKNTLQSLHGAVIEIHIDSEGGNILGTIKITGARQVWHIDSNDYYRVSAEITQGY